MKGYDFEALTARWVEEVEGAVATLARAARDETFYALAFHGAYAERGRKICGPVVGASSEEGLRELHGDDDDDGDDEGDDEGDGDGGGGAFEGVRWNPADWKYEELERPDGAGNARAYQALNAAAAGGSLAAWDRMLARHDRAILAAARELARRARAGAGAFAQLRRSPDFVVFVHDPSRAGVALARRTIPARVFARLFPAEAARAAARAAIDRLPPAARARHAVSRFGVFTPPLDSEQAVELLVGLGAAAVPALVEALDHPEHGWQAAMTLARIGAPAARRAAPALRDQLARGTGASMWSAVALAALGHLDELAALAARPGRRRPAERRDDAVRALVHVRPASYPHLAALLDRKDRGLTRVIGEALRPGSAAYEPSPRDWPALAALATSPHAVLRRDLACALADDALEPIAPRCAALLATLLADRDAEVRRLAAVNLGFLRQAGRPHADALRAAQADRDPKVAEAARQALVELAPAAG